MPDLPSERRRIAAAGGFLFAALLVGKVEGFLREVIIAHQFGTSGQTDLYALAFTVPDLLVFLIVAGVVSSAFVPVVTERLARGDEGEAVAVVNGVMAAGLLVLVGGVIVFELLTPTLVHALIPQRPATEQELAITLTRIILVQPLFIGSGGFAIGVMNAYRRFGPIAVAPLAYDAAIIVGALFLTRVHVGREALGIRGLAIGVVLGGALHIGVQAPALWKIGWRPLALRQMGHPAVRRVALLMLPIAVGAIATRVNVAVDNTLGARLLSTGGISSLYYANILAQVPNLTFTTALTVVLFPYFARDAALGDRDSLRRRAALSVRLNLFVLIPSAVAFVVLGPQIVALVLQRGAFNAESTRLVAGPLAALSVGIAAQASIFLVLRVFYSLQQVLTPMFISLVAVATNLAGSFLLIAPMGASGLALATSIASIVNFTLLVLFVRRRIGGFEGRRMMRSLAEVAAGCVPLALVAAVAWRVLAGDGPVILDVRHYVAMVVALAGAGAAFLGTEFALRSPEAHVAVGAVLRRRTAIDVSEAAPPA